MTTPTVDTSYFRVPLPAEDEIRRVIGATYNSEKTLNVIKMLAGTGDMYPAAVSFIQAVFRASGVDPRIREMIVLRAAKRYNVLYEWQANAMLASNVGLSPEEILAAASEGKVTNINPEYVLASIATDELSDDGRLSDETLQELLNRYGESVTRKIILIISWFNLLSRFVNGCRVPPETTNKIGAGTSPV